MKDLPSPWQVIPFSPAYLGLEEGQQQARPLPPVKDPMGGKLPLTPWLKMQINEGLFENVAKPMAERGYPSLGAGMAAVPATLSDLLIPETYGDVMGAGVIGKGGKGLDNVVDMFAKKKELQAAGKLTDSPWSGMSKGAQSKPSPWTDVDTRNQGISTLEDVEDYFKKQYGPADGQHGSPTPLNPFRIADTPPKEKSGYDRYLDRYADFDEPTSQFKKLNDEGFDEPYAGSDISNPVYHKGRHKNVEPTVQMPVFKVDPKGHLGKRVAEGGADPFAWMDSKYGAGKKVLQEHADKPLKISTRSDLIAHDDYIEHLNPGKHEVNFHVFSDNARVNRAATPGAPSLERVLKAAEKLREKGVKVNLVVDQVKGVNPKFNDVMDMEVLGRLKKAGINLQKQAIEPSDPGLLERAFGKDLMDFLND